MGAVRGHKLRLCDESMVEQACRCTVLRGVGALGGEQPYEVLDDTRLTVWTSARTAHKLREQPWVLGDSSTFFSESSDPVVDDEKMLNEAYVLGEGQPTAEAKRIVGTRYITRSNDKPVTSWTVTKNPTIMMFSRPVSK